MQGAASTDGQAKTSLMPQMNALLDLSSYTIGLEGSLS